MTAAQRPIVRWLASPRAEAAWKLMALVALLLSIGIGARQLQMTACQARYAEISNASQAGRAAAATADREALDRLLQVVAKTPDRTIDAVREYNATRAAADAQRARNPVPPPPSGACG